MPVGLTEKIREFIANRANRVAAQDEAADKYGPGGFAAAGAKYQNDAYHEDPTGYVMGSAALVPGTIGGRGALGFGEAKAAGKTFVGPEGIERFEIPDQESIYHPQNFADEVGYGKKENISGRLSDLLQHDPLYENYPQLEDLKVSITRHNMGKTMGQYNSGWNMGDGMIKLHPDYVYDPQMGHSTLLHEIQHALQHEEGFASGGSADAQFYDSYLGDLKNEFNRLNTRPNGTMYDTKTMPERARQILAEIRGIENWRITPNDLYKRLAGEAEARNVEGRMNWSDKQRNTIPFNESFDVPPSLQIVRK